MQLNCVLNCNLWRLSFWNSEPSYGCLRIFEIFLCQVCWWDFLQTLSLKRCRSGNERFISYSSCLNTREEGAERPSFWAVVTVESELIWLSFSCQISNLAGWQPSKTLSNKQATGGGCDFCLHALICAVRTAKQTWKCSKASLFFCGSPQTKQT